MFVTVDMFLVRCLSLLQPKLLLIILSLLAVAVVKTVTVIQVVAVAQVGFVHR